MRKVTLIIVCLFTLICACKNYNKIATIVTSQQLKEVIIKDIDVQLIDVRTLEEYNKGSIKGAINIDIKNLSSFKTQAIKLNKQEPVYVYCQKGGRSNRASKILKDLGFEKIYDYSSGYSEWTTLNK